MGWSFQLGASREDIIRELTAPVKSDGYSRRTLAHCLKGNILWQVVEIITDHEERYILCSLLGLDKNEDGSHVGWGSKEMEEACHPYYYTCPKAYLDMVPEVGNQEWRDVVLKRDEDRRVARELVKTITVGSTVWLRPGFKPHGPFVITGPDVVCSGAINSAKKAEMQAARNALVAACRNAPSSSFKSLSGTATLTGVGFFDVIHGQTGVAPNGIELHPILSFTGTCSSSSSTPTATTAAPAATPTTSTAGDSNGPWYTSSFGSATYYYCSADPGWRRLSPTYLQNYPSEAALLAVWGGRRTKHTFAGC